MQELKKCYFCENDNMELEFIAFHGLGCASCKSRIEGQMKKFKPCPFCGEHAAYITDFLSNNPDKQGVPNRYIIVCMSCGIATPEYLILDCAETHWNRRAEAIDARSLNPEE